MQFLLKLTTLPSNVSLTHFKEWKQAEPWAGETNQWLGINQTAKGRKEGKNQTKGYISISYGKGVTIAIALCKPFTHAMNSHCYCNLIVLKISQRLAPIW